MSEDEQRVHAILLCVYRNDDLDLFKDVLHSIPASVNNSIIRIYLHIDGNIPDELCDFIESMKDRFYLIKKSPINVGLAAGLNILINELGDEMYIFRVDADDVNLKNRFIDSINFLDQNSTIDVVGGSVLEVYASKLDTVKKVSYYDNLVDINRFIVYRTPLAHNTVCFRRKVFSDGIRYPLAKLTEDILLWSDLILKGYNLYSLSQPFVISRIGPSFFERRGILRAFSEFKAYLVISKAHNHIVLGFFFACIRLLLRLMPPVIKRYFYLSRIR